MSMFAVVETIPEYFAGKNLFVTGATGFLGKVLLEKLLRSCPEIGDIYVLVRPKKGTQPDDRVKKIVEFALFDRLKEERPDAIKKLKAVAGDVTQLNLGLNPSDRATLIENTHIVIHSAASVRFDDPLTDAILMNTRGTREVANLVLEMKKISVFVHVSTTYCNTDRVVIGEQLYPPHADWRAAIKMAEKVDRHTVDVLTAKYLGELPNTYTFTKSMGEHVVHDLCGGRIPTVVFRPSIVISTIKEPVVGWMDNFNGPVGLLVASGKGIIKGTYGSPEVIADYMPVDLAIKALIMAIWEKGGNRSLHKKLEVSFYNCSSYDRQPLTMGEMVNLGKSLCWEVPIANQLWYPCGDITDNIVKYYLITIFLHVLPAVFFDAILRLSGRKPMLLKIQRRIFIANMALSYFLVSQWSFLNDKLIAIEKTLHDSDVEDFGFDAESVDVYEFFKNGMIGGKKYLLKEDVSEKGIEKAKAHMRRMWILHCITMFLFYVLGAWFVYSRIRSFVFSCYQ